MEIRVLKLFMVLSLLLTLTSISQSAMPTVIGNVGFNDEAYRDNVYNWLVEHSTKCVNLKHIVKYTHSVTGDYMVGTRLHFLTVNKSIRNFVETKVIQVKNDSRTVFMRIKILLSTNNEPAGTCHKGTTERLITK